MKISGPAIAMGVCLVIMNLLTEREKKAVHPPHSHIDHYESPMLDVSSPISASGGDSQALGYSVMLRPRFDAVAIDDGCRMVRSIDVEGAPIAGGQRMYRRFSDINELARELAESLALPAAQIEAICRSLQKGSVNQIGGHFGFATTVFYEQQLTGFGMSFRPLEG